MSKKEKRVTLIRFDQRRICRLRPLARLSLRQLLLELCMTELLVALALALPGAGALGRLPCDTVRRVVCRISGSGTVSALSAA